PRGERGREIFVEEVQYAADATTRFVGNLRERHGLPHFLLQRAPGLGEHEQLRDRRVERQLRAREPDRREVALHEIAVRQVEERRANFAMYHRLRIAEEILVVRALR